MRPCYIFSVTVTGKNTICRFFTKHYIHKASSLPRLVWHFNPVIMIRGKEKEPLTAEVILQKVDDYNIFRYYLGQDFNFKKKYKSPFRGGREDKTPNLSFFVRKGKIFFKDFAGEDAGDCFAFVMRLFNLNYYEALVRIDRDFGLNIRPNAEVVTKIELVKKPAGLHLEQKKLLQIVPKPFTKKELSYWGAYPITQEELESKNIYSIEKLYINKRLIPNFNKEIRFAYKFDEYLKIYTPLAKEFKWISNTPNDFMSGFDDIKYKILTNTQSEKLIITKSVKDELILKKFFPDVCSTQNESSEAINAENINWILRGYEPHNVYIAYDNDEPGVKSSTFYTSTYGFNYVNVPKIFIRERIKDWSDLSKAKGLETVGNYLKIKNLII